MTPTKSEHLTLRIDPVLDALIVARATERGLSVSAHVRDLAERDVREALDLEGYRPLDEVESGNVR